MFYKVSASTREVALENYLSPDLPATASFDPQALKQILNNFLSNAIKFTPKGGSILVSAFVVHGGLLPALSIDFDKYKVFPAINDLKTKKDSICIAVSDTGIGIPESDLNRLFQTYKQAKISPVAKDEKGTGLGLVIAKGIAEAHDGTVGVVSKEGMGSTFFFTLPL
jgi:signal transduction histidine kinase